MNHDIYAFGSIVKGDILPSSDVDILAIPTDVELHELPETWSVYSRQTIVQYFNSGRLFAWHLHLDAKLIYSPNDQDFLHTLGQPVKYETAREDINDLSDILKVALRNLQNDSRSETYEFGIVYTALRDIAMSASYVLMDRPIFSRLSPYEIPVVCPLPKEVYEKAMLARHCSTRGKDSNLNFTIERMDIRENMFDDWLANIECKL